MSKETVFNTIKCEAICCTRGVVATCASGVLSFWNFDLLDTVDSHANYRGHCLNFSTPSFFTEIPKGKYSCIDMVLTRSADNVFIITTAAACSDNTYRWDLTYTFSRRGSGEKKQFHIDSCASEVSSSTIKLHSTSLYLLGAESSGLVLRNDAMEVLAVFHGLAETGRKIPVDFSFCGSGQNCVMACYENSTIMCWDMTSKELVLYEDVAASDINAVIGGGVKQTSRPCRMLVIEQDIQESRYATYEDPQFQKHIEAESFRRRGSSSNSSSSGDQGRAAASIPNIGDLRVWIILALSNGKVKLMEVTTNLQRAAVSAIPNDDQSQRQMPFYLKERCATDLSREIRRYEREHSVVLTGGGGVGERVIASPHKYSANKNNSKTQHSGAFSVGGNKGGGSRVSTDAIADAAQSSKQAANAITRDGMDMPLSISFLPAMYTASKEAMGSLRLSDCHIAVVTMTSVLILNLQTLTITGAYSIESLAPSVSGHATVAISTIRMWKEPSLYLEEKEENGTEIKEDAEGKFDALDVWVIPMLDRSAHHCCVQLNELIKPQLQQQQQQQQHRARVTVTGEAKRSSGQLLPPKSSPHLSRNRTNVAASPHNDGNPHCRHDSNTFEEPLSLFTVATSLEQLVTDTMSSSNSNSPLKAQKSLLAYELKKGDNVVGNINISKRSASAGRRPRSDGGTERGGVGAGAAGTAGRGAWESAKFDKNNKPIDQPITFKTKIKSSGYGQTVQLTPQEKARKSYARNQAAQERKRSVLEAQCQAPMQVYDNNSTAGLLGGDDSYSSRYSNNGAGSSVLSMQEFMAPGGASAKMRSVADRSSSSSGSSSRRLSGNSGSVTAAAAAAGSVSAVRKQSAAGKIRRYPVECDIMTTRQPANDIPSSSVAETLPPIHSICFNSDGSMLGLATNAAAVFCARMPVSKYAKKGENVMSLLGHNARVNSVCFSHVKSTFRLQTGKESAQSSLLSGSADCTARLWKAGASSVLFTHTKHQPGDVYTVVGAGGVVGGAGSVQVGGATAGSTLLRGTTGPKFGGAGGTNASLVANGAAAAGGGRGGTGGTLGFGAATNNTTLNGGLHSDGALPTQQQRNRPFGAEVSSAKFYYLDKFVLLVVKASVYMYSFDADAVTVGNNDLKRTEKNLSIGKYKLVHCWTFSPDAHSVVALTCVNSVQSPIILCSTSDKKIHVLDASAGTILRTVGSTHDKNVHCLALPQPSLYTPTVSPEAHNVFTSSAIDNAVVCWDLRSPSSMARFTSHVNKREPVQCAISPCLRYVATGSEDRTARIFDLRGGRELCKLQGGHRDAVCGIAFNPAFAQLCTASYDGTVRFYIDPTSINADDIGVFL